MPKCTINGQAIEVDRGVTVIQAAAELGFDVPHFCYHPALSVPANCRMCLIEIEPPPGRPPMKLQPACYTQVAEGMVVQTESERVLQARRAVLEFILVNHPVDCPICDQAGECKLQDYYMDYDAQASRVRTSKVSKAKVLPLGPEVVYDGERCILCTRCVRFCDEVTGTSELTVTERGDRSEIRTFAGRELDNAYSLCTVDLCPVGALTSRDFRFKCRVWLLTSTDSICTGCSRGCSIHLEHHRNEIQRYRPRFNPEINEYWMCDAGRHTYNEVHRDRVQAPAVGGQALTWPRAYEQTAARLKAAVEAHGADATAFVFSPQAACEDLYAARGFAEGALGATRHYVGGRPEGAGDDFLITPDKNPNRNGLLVMFPRDRRPAPFQRLLADLEAGEIKVLYMMGSEIPLDGEERARFLAAVAKVDLFVLQAPRQDELGPLAHVLLPAATHAEKEGTYVNCDGIAQQTRQGLQPIGGALPEWQVFVQLARRLEKPLAYSFVKQLRDEMFKVMEENSAAAAS